MGVSVIIPAYNAEKTIEKAVLSVLGDGSDNVEVIVVNDGSADRTEDVVKKLSEKYRNVRLYSKPNGGVSSARNLGIEKAAESFIMFLDADDTSENGAVQRMLNIVRDNRTDIAMLAYRTVGENENRIFCPPFIGRIEGKNDIFDKIICPIAFSGENGYMGSVCTSIFKKSIISDNGIRFDPRVKIAEDTLFLTSYLLNCKSVFTSDDIALSYNLANGSATKKYNPTLAENNRVLGDELKKAVENAGLDYTDEIDGKRAVSDVISLIVNEARRENPNGMACSFKKIRRYSAEYKSRVKKCSASSRTLKIKKQIALHPLLGTAFLLVRKIQAARGISF